MYQDFFIDFNPEHAKHILNLFEVPLNRRLAQLSKGQRGKVQLALTLGRKVDLYILDEPLDGMDPASRDLIMKIVIKYKKPDSTVLISTHQITDIESYLDYVVLLKKGQILEYRFCQRIRKSIICHFLHTLRRSINMMKKLYKWDLIHYFGQLKWIFLGTLFVTVLSVIFKRLAEINFVWAMFHQTAFIISIVGILIGLVYSFFSIFQRYYHTILKDEAYFTHTLPISKGKILLSKVLSGFTLFLLAIIVTVGLLIWIDVINVTAIFRFKTDGFKFI